TTLAGRAGVRGASDGIGVNASFNFPAAVTVDLAGNVYVSDSGNKSVRVITPGGAVSTLAGEPPFDDRLTPVGGSNDGVGRAASFADPLGLATDVAGNIFVADRDNNTIRRITPQGVVSTFAGLAPDKAIGWSDSIGTEARFRYPGAVTVAPDGTCFVVDTIDPVVRKITPSGVVTTLAGASGQKGYAEGAGAAARFSSLGGIARDASGNLYVIDQRKLVRKITPDGTVSTFAGRLGSETKPVDAQGANAVFVDLHAIAVAPDNSVWVVDGGDTSADPTHGGSAILFRRITPDGQVTTDERLRGVLNPRSLISSIAFSGGGPLYAADAPYSRVLKITAGAIESIYPNATLPAQTTPLAPRAITVDSLGRVYMIDGNYSTRIACVLPSGVVKIVAGTTTAGNTDGFADDALLYAAHSIAVDAEGSLYVTSNSLVRKAAIASAPTFLTAPQSQSVASGSSVTLSTNVRAVPAPQYQWYFNGVALAGATSASYTISSARAGDAGDYTVVATNALGTATSARATLSISAGGTSGGGSTGGAGGGGGGAPSDFFVAACAALALMRGWLRAPALRRRE
ncbi:MAG TPA: immunoglobulin domain-containing protein, partial [Acidobacteriota bacterium]|nr:immunoglobulin domain-containing protein [Acidobacteriota bacterium]